MSGDRWIALQTFVGREHEVRADLEDLNSGAFLPTFARASISRGRLNVTERPMLPGYVMFRNYKPAVHSIEHVVDVLGYVRDDEVSKLMMAHALGQHNEMVYDRNAAGQFARKKRRKPRPGNRIRKAMQASVHTNRQIERA